MSVDLALVRRNKIAPIEAVTLTWWRKEGDDYRAAMRERDRSKLTERFEPIQFSLRIVAFTLWSRLLKVMNYFYYVFNVVCVFDCLFIVHNYLLAAPYI
jgi:hypothetical protein